MKKSLSSLLNNLCVMRFSLFKAALQKRSGFTLIEVLLYAVLAGSILYSISSFFGTVIEGRIKNQAIAEVEEQGVQILQTITQTIRNASSINSPASGSTSGSLSLGTYDGTKSPTVFDLVSNAIRIKEGTGTVVNLSSSRVIASGVNFVNLSKTGSPGTIRIQFTLSHVNQTGRNEYSYSKSFTASASLRQP